MSQLYLWTKIHIQQWLVVGASAFQGMRAGFLCHQMRQFCLFTYPSRLKWGSTENMIFFFPESTSSVSLSETKTHWMVNWLQQLNQLDFVWHHTKVFMPNLSPWCLRNVQLLRTTLKWCWWRFAYTLCHSSNTNLIARILYRASFHSRFWNNLRF